SFSAMAIAGGALSVWFVYLPCMVMVVRRPNEGTLPAWLEHRINGWPGWLRGAPIGLDRPRSQ
ncbi:MAG: hypothetical protein DMD35_05120, partial [Gemmatimonadetes bacterium]